MAQISPANDEALEAYPAGRDNVLGRYRVIAKPSCRRNHDIIIDRTEPSAPPRKGAIRNDKMVADGHEAKILRGTLRGRSVVTNKCVWVNKRQIISAPNYIIRE
jgi:hypothetical protein